MRKKTSILICLLLFAVFCGAAMALRLPAGGAWSVRARGEAAKPTPPLEEVRAALELLPDERIDLNAADAEELQKLPGIGAALSEAIVRYREEHGPFERVEELLDVPGIGQGRFAAIEDSVAVFGSSQEDAP